MSLLTKEIQLLTNNINNNNSGHERGSMGSRKMIWVMDNLARKDLRGKQ